MKTSSARRVHHVLKAAIDFPVSRPGNSISIWARIFELIPPDFDGQLPPDVEYAVLDMLRDLRAEVANVERQVRGTEAEAATTPIAEVVRYATATNVLHTDWMNVKSSHLKPELVAGWNWAAISLAHLDEEYDPAEIAQLRQDLEELEKTARESQLPHELRMLVDKQVRQIRSALRRYEICGAAVLRDAANAVVGEALKHHEVIVAAESAESPDVRAALGQLRRVWGGLVHAAGDADKLRKGIEAAGALVKALPFL